MKTRSNSAGTQLKQAQTAINNTLGNATIKAVAATFGYTVARLNAGRTLLNAAIAAVDEATFLAGAQREATQEVRDTFKAARGAFQGLAKVARAIFKKQPEHLTALGLDDPMPVNMDDFAASAQTLFNSGEYPTAITTALENNGYGSSKLSTERGKIAEFNAARDAQAAAVSDAEQATKDKTDALQALHDWYMEFRKIMRVALKDKPLSLKKLGIPYRVTKSKAQRGAPAKAKATRASKKVRKAA